MGLRELLGKLRKIIDIDYAVYTNSGLSDWDGGLHFSGIKRLIYGLLHGGYNESGDDLCKQMESDEARGLYVELAYELGENEELMRWLIEYFYPLGSSIAVNYYPDSLVVSDIEVDPERIVIDNPRNEVTNYRCWRIGVLHNGFLVYIHPLDIVNYGGIL